MEIQIKINVADYERLKEKFTENNIPKAVEQLDNLVLDKTGENYYGNICFSDRQINEFIYLTKRLYFRRQYNFSAVLIDVDTKLKGTIRFQSYDEILKQLRENNTKPEEICEIRDDKQNIDITKSVLQDLQNIKSTGKFNPLHIDNDEDDCE